MNLINSDTNSLEHKVFSYIPYTDAANHVASQVRKELHNALSRESAGTTQTDLEEKIIAESSQAYLCNPPADHLIASEESEEQFRLGSPKQNGPAMIAWLLGSLTLEERQVVLLLRFSDHFSVAKLLSLEESRVYYLSELAERKIIKRKEETKWTSNPDAELIEVFGYDEDGEKKVPDEKKFHKMYEAYWGAAINKLAYYILADRLGAANVEDTVRVMAYEHVENQTFDVTNPWKGDAKGIWPGFQQLTFDACEEEIRNFSKEKQKHAYYEGGDVWAMGINELSVPERKCLLLSTFYHKPDYEGINAICIALDYNKQSTVKKHIKTAFDKIIKRSHQMYGG